MRDGEYRTWKLCRNCGMGKRRHDPKLPWKEQARLPFIPAHRRHMWDDETRAAFAG